MHALQFSAQLLNVEQNFADIVPAYALVSTAAAFVLAWLRPVFVDVDSHTLGPDSEAGAAAITPRTRAICTIHYAGVGSHPNHLTHIAADRNSFLI
jgi:dTDP-4-amino-4,6-dideoxygalactose transaminase